MTLYRPSEYHALELNNPRQMHVHGLKVSHWILCLLVPSPIVRT